MTRRNGTTTSGHPIGRRSILAAGTALVGGSLLPMPYLSRVRAQEGPLKFWQFYAPGGGVPGQSKWFEDTVKGWNDSQEVKVELVYVPNIAYMDGTKLPTAFASGDGPDLFIISPGDFLRYYNGGVLLDLTPFMEREGRADFSAASSPTAWSTARSTAFPMEVEPMAMYYSVEAFKEAGLTENDIPKTWDQLLAVAQEADQRRSASASCSRPIPATTRTSPGIRSCGRAAARSQARTARAPSTPRRQGRR